jgi:hypothetical protein
MLYGDNIEYGHYPHSILLKNILSDLLIQLQYSNELKDLDVRNGFSFVFYFNNIEFVIHITLSIDY